MSRPNHVMQYQAKIVCLDKVAKLLQIGMFVPCQRMTMREDWLRGIPDRTGLGAEILIGNFMYYVLLHEMLHEKHSDSTAVDCISMRTLRCAKMTVFFCLH